MSSNENIMDNPAMRYHLGMAYFKNGDTENAKRELKRPLNWTLSLQEPKRRRVC